MASQTLEALQAVVEAAIVLLSVEDDVNGMGYQGSQALKILAEAVNLQPNLPNRCIICGDEDCLKDH